jgi:membrane-bound serine protease (ClpP class)
MKRLTVAAILICCFLGMAASAQEAWILRIDGEIGAWTVSYVQRGLREAASGGTDAVVLVFSTPGGLLDSAVETRRLLLEADLRTIAYVSLEALSAGAMLAISCETILFAPGGVMGAATPVLITGGAFDEAPEKVISATRSLFRASAELFDRPTEVAEAMVDRDIAIPGLVEAGKLLTLSSREALQWGYSDGEVASVREWLTAEGFGTVREVEVQWVDRLIGFLLSPVVAGILIAVGLIGLMVEMLVPGFGIPGLVGFLSLGAFFWAHFLVGFAGWESVAFLLAGLVAIILEIFAFTAVDFGFSGLVGLVLIGLGFYNAMIGPLGAQGQAAQAVATVTISVIASVVLAIVLITRLPKTRLRLGGIILSSAITGRSFGSKDEAGSAGSWLGRSGIAVTDLRPVGVGEFSGERTDVICEEGHLPKGTPIVVIKDHGYRRVVHRHTPSEKEGATK